MQRSRFLGDRDDREPPGPSRGWDEILQSWTDEYGDPILPDQGSTAWDQTEIESSSEEASYDDPD